jgi:hypothetical protein
MPGLKPVQGIIGNTGKPYTEPDPERDNELKKRLQEVIHKYNIKQVEVARETGK